MSKKMQFRVVREHYGDRAYAEGETRIAAESEVAHLVPHVLEPIGPASDDVPAEKAEPAPANKAEPAAPANKAVTSPKRKTGK